MLKILSGIVVLSLCSNAYAASPTPCNMLDPSVATEWSLERCDMNRYSQMILPENLNGVSIKH